MSETLMNLEKRIKDIEYRLSHIVELPNELDIRLQDVERKLDGLGNGYSKLKKEVMECDHDERITDLENIGAENRLINLETDFNNVRALGTRAHCPKPYLCPVCNGHGSFDLRSIEEAESNDKIKIKICNSCKGNGIVWG